MSHPAPHPARAVSQQKRSGPVRPLIWLVGAATAATLFVAGLLWAWGAMWSVAYGHSPTVGSALASVRLVLPWFLAQVAAGGAVLALGRRVDLVRWWPAFAQGLLSWSIALTVAVPLLKAARALLG